MRVELTRYRVLPGKADRVAEWMAFLNANEPAMLETFPAEQMFVETIFSEVVEGAQYLYWFSIQGDDAAAAVEQSEHWLDRKHLEYWDECIDPSYQPVDLVVREHVAAPEIARIIARGWGTGAADGAATAA